MNEHKDCEKNYRELVDNEKIKAIIKQYADKGKKMYSEAVDSRGSRYNVGFWDGYESCAKGLLRELEDMQEVQESKPKFKIGDTIIHVDDGVDIIYKEHKVINVLDLGYILDNGHSIEIADQDDWLVVHRCSVDEAMAEVEEKAKAFTDAHKGEDSEKILAEMRGEEPVSEDLKQFEETYLDKEKDEILCVYDRHAGLVDGAKWQKQQLMKDAVDCFSVKRDVAGISLLILNNKAICGVNDGDKVKVVILKEK